MLGLPLHRRPIRTSLFEPKSPFPGNGNFRAETTGPKPAPNVYGRYCRDKISLNNPANSGLVAEIREISVSVLEPPTKRLWRVSGAFQLDRRLETNKFIVGSEYTIADIAAWPWYAGLTKGWLYEAAEFLQAQEYKNVARWVDAIAERPAVRRGRMVNRVTGEASSQLHERHDASDFETKTQDKLTTGG